MFRLSQISGLLLIVVFAIGCGQSSNAVTAYMRGLASARQGDNDAAILDFTESIRLDPKMVSAYNNRGALSATKATMTPPSRTSPKRFG